MSKVISVILAAILIFSIPTTVSAESTTLTIDVPEASYILNVPANQAIDYLASEKNIGSITVSDTSGFSASKGITVSVTYSLHLTINGQGIVTIDGKQHSKTTNVPIQRHSEPFVEILAAKDYYIRSVT